MLYIQQAALKYLFFFPTRRLRATTEHLFHIYVMQNPAQLTFLTNLFDYLLITVNSNYPNQLRPKTTRLLPDPSAGDQLL